MQPVRVAVISIVSPPPRGACAWAASFRHSGQAGKQLVDTAAEVTTGPWVVSLLYVPSYSCVVRMCTPPQTLRAPGNCASLRYPPLDLNALEGQGHTP